MVQHLSCLALLELASLLIFAAAFWNKSAFRYQVGERHFLTWSENKTNLMGIILANPATAALLYWHAALWERPYMIVILVLVVVVGAIGLRDLLKDSKKNPSAFFEYGKLTLAGTFYQFGLWPVQVSVLASFYILTPRVQVTDNELFWVTLAFVIVWLISTLQPPKKMHGKLNAMAVAMAIGGTVLLIGGAFYLGMKH